MLTKEQSASLPDRMGVYIIKDATGKVIYVGKAKSIRARLAQHNNPGVSSQYGLPGLYDYWNQKAAAMAAQIHSVDYILADTEVETLILENNLIKKHLPKYNIRMRDDKSYPWVKVTLKDTYPAVVLTREPTKDGSKYFGPYLNIEGLETSVKFLRRLFPIRNCKRKLETQEVNKMGRGKSPTKRPCLDYHLKRCLGPCIDPSNPDVRERYMSAVEGLCLALDNKAGSYIEELEQRMNDCASRQDFEEAARLRDLILHLGKLTSRQKVISPKFRDYDAVAAVFSPHGSCVYLFAVREGRLVGKEHFAMDGVDVTGIDTEVTLSTDQAIGQPNPSEKEILVAFLKQHYGTTRDIPPEIQVEHYWDELDAISKWLQERRGSPVTIHVPKRKDILRMARQNALFHTDLKKPDEATSAANELQKAIGLTAPPRRIEAVDISLMQGNEAVGSLVVFENGKAKKSMYRRFKIRSVEGQDDYAMLAEVTTRRFLRLQEEKSPYPDLLLIDGGRGQLSAVSKALAGIGITGVSLASIAKREEEVFVPSRLFPIELPRGSAGLKLLQAARDEAHRFAVSYHRRLRGKRMGDSELLSIKGVGRRRAALVLKHFGSMEKLRRATVEEIKAVPGIPISVAAKVRAWLDGEKGT